MMPPRLLLERDAVQPNRLVGRRDVEDEVPPRVHRLDRRHLRVRELEVVDVKVLRDSWALRHF